MALGTPVAAAAAYSAANGTTVTPAYPTGILTTDVVLLFVGQKPNTANGGTVTTPTGWTLREEITGAGGYGATLGADTGNTNLRIYSWNSPVAGQTGNLSVTLGANNVSWAFILRVPSTRPTGSTITFGSADGQRTTTPTSPLSVALTNGTSATNFKAGDLAIWAMCIPTDVTTPAQFSAQGITATGATFGTVTEINEPDSGNGNDIGGFSARALVTSGNSSTAPTITATLAGTLTNVRGPVALIRIRETAVLIGDPQTYNETLQPATLTVDRTVTASSDTFAFNGNDVTLTKTSAAKTLTADVATFTEDLKPANLTVSRTLSCDSATYTEDLKSANLLVGRKLLAVGEREQQVFTDDFERADQALDSTSAWLRADLEVGSLSIVSGKAVGSNIGNVYNQTLANNQWAQLNFGGVFASGTGKGAAILLRGTGGQSSFTGYSISLERDNFDIGDVLRIRRHLSDTTFSDAYTNGLLVASTRVAEFASNSPDTILKAEIIGDTIYAYVNGILALIANNSTVSSGFTGIWSDTATISTFSAGGLGPTKVTLNSANLIVSRKLVAKVYADEQLFSDDFTGTNGVLGAEYTQQGDANIRRDGLGNANAVGVGRGLAWPNTVTFADSHYAEITITAIETSSNNSGIGLRIQNSASPAVEYGYIFRTGNAGAAYTFAQYNASSVNVNIITTSVIPQIGDRLRAVVVGNNQYFYVNDQLIAVGSSTSWSGGVPAIYGNGTVWKSDNFVAGNYGGLHLAGTYTNTRADRILVCASASYILELKDATLTKVSAKVLVADSQTYTEDLQPANLKAGKRLVADSQTYTEDLQPANLTAARTLLATTQTYTEDLQPANLKAARTLLATTQTYTEDLQPANLTAARTLLATTQTYNEDLKPANLKATRTLLASTQTYNEDLKPANLKVEKRLVADRRIYSISTSETTFRLGRRIAADKQTYVLTGIIASFKTAGSLIADVRSYTLTGNPAGTLRFAKLSAAATSYTFNGNPANLARGKKLVADTASYNETLRDATLRVTRKVTADTRSYSFNGQATNLSKGFRLFADTCSYSLTGNDANLARGKKLVADVSSYSLSGQSANLRVGRNLTGDVRSYALSTNAANLLEFKRLVADVRTYTLSGQSANLLENSRLVAESRTYTLTRNDATLKVTRRLVADTRSYALTGNNFFFGTAGKITADTRSYTFTGNAANLVRSRILISSSQSYNLVINDAALKSSKRIISDKATYTLTGRTANILAGERGPSDSRNFILTGNAASLTVTRKLISAVFSYTLTENDANLKSGRKVALSLSSYVTSGKAANLFGNRKIQLVRTFFDTNGYVDPGYTDPNYVSIGIGMRAARKLAAQVTSFNLNGIAVNINRGGFIKVWTGSAWVSKPLKVWDGAAWVSKPLKIWDGTTWRIY